MAKKQAIIYCGSCGKPMANESDFGTEENGEKSKEYCDLCYQNGSWTEPDISFEDFYAKSYEGFINSDMSSFQKFFLKKMYTKKFVKKLKRWKDA